MLVYRVDLLINEVETHPYNTSIEDDLIRDMWSVHTDPITHPDIDSDLLVYRSVSRFLDYICGCDSIDKLMDWFGEYFWKLLDKNQLVVNCYETNEILDTVSKKQLMFRKDTATLIQKLTNVDDIWSKMLEEI